MNIPSSFPIFQGLRCFSPHTPPPPPHPTHGPPPPSLWGITGREELIVKPTQKEEKVEQEEVEKEEEVEREEEEEGENT